MAIMTPPSDYTKGSRATYTLDKTELAAHATVSGDAYFSDSANWKYVEVLMVSTVGNQRELLRFQAQHTTPTAGFLVSARAKDSFEVRRLTIRDFDNGILTLSRSDLVTAEYDVSVAVVAASQIFYADYESSINANVPSALAPFANPQGLAPDAGWVEDPTGPGTSPGLVYSMSDVELGATGAVYCNFVAKYTGNPSSSKELMDIGGLNHNKVVIYHTNSGAIMILMYDSTGAGSALTSSNTGGSWSPTEWQAYQLAVEWESGTISVKIDDTLIHSATYTPGLRSAISSCYIRPLSAVDGNVFKYVDEYNVYSSPDAVNGPKAISNAPTEPVNDLPFDMVFDTSLLDGAPASTTITDSEAGLVAIHDDFNNLVIVDGTTYPTGWVEYAFPNNLNLGESGSVVVDVKFNLDDLAGNVFSIQHSNGNNANALELKYDGAGGLYVVMRDSAGTEILNSSGAPTAITVGVGTTVHSLAIEWNFLLNNDVKLYNTGILEDTLTASGGIGRTEEVTVYNMAGGLSRSADNLIILEVSNASFYETPQIP